MAASEDEVLASIALKYFVDNPLKYPDYDPHNFKELKFVPAVSPDGRSLKGSPMEVFTSPEASVLKLLVVHPSVRDIASEKLKLKVHPPTSLIMPLLEKNAPNDTTTARSWFEALAGRIAGPSHTCAFR